MRGLILAAGRGSRMRAETADRPKCMVELLGKALVHWQIEALHSAGVDPVAVVGGYRGDQLPDELTAFDNPHWAETNMASSLACAASWLREGPTVVSYADIVYPAAAPTSLVRAPGDVCITCDVNWLDLWSRRFEDPLSDAETLRIEAGRVVEIGERPERLDSIEAQYMGLLKLTPAGSEALLCIHRALAPADRDRIDLTSLLRAYIREGGAVHAVPYDSWWCEVDSPSDLVVAEQIAGSRA